jgi:hypothetical protein
LVLVLELKLLLTNHLQYWCARRMFACLLAFILQKKKPKRLLRTYTLRKAEVSFHTHTRRERERERWTYTV